MDHSTFTRYLRIVFKIFTCLDTNNRQLQKRMIFLRTLPTVLIFVSTIDCFFTNDKDEKENVFSKIHDITILFIMLFSEVVLVLKKEELCSLIEFITEPLELRESNNDHMTLIEKYNKEIFINAKIMTVVLLVVVINWSPLNFLFGYSRPGEDPCVHAIIGWLRWDVEFDTYVVYLRLYFALLTTTLIVNTDLILEVVVFAIIKIKFQIRLLCKDVYAIKTMVNETEAIQALERFPVTNLNIEELLMRIESLSGSNNSEVNISERMQNLEGKINITMDLREYFIKKEVNNQVKKYFKVVVDQHVDIIENIKLLDQSFRQYFMAYIYGAVFVAALNVPKINTTEDLVSIEHLHRIAEVVLIMVFMAYINYFGQTLLNELELLRKALYYCDWVDVPLSAKRGLLIMQTVANAPPRLTIGGTLNLSMETFGNIASAVFSYINVIQSLK